MNRADPNVLSGAEIAVIGMACRLPGADDVEAYWQNLRNGVESVTFFTDAELLAAGIDLRELRAPNYVRANAVLADFDKFDAAFFGFGSQEVELTDPQHRLFLECAHTALEHAGVCPAEYPGAIGVFAGAGMNGYLLKNLYPNREHLPTVNEFQIMIWNDKDHLATKSAYKLNLRGPCVTVQTACSTSLVAIHLACQSLLNGECDLALAGGVSLRLPQIAGYLYQEGMVESPDGHCRAFDAKGRGFVHGSGVGLVVLKPLTEALVARDHIHAIIKGTAINNDGSAKVGYAAPGVDGQARVIAEAQAVAQVDPATITYIEAHGTATPLGDLIEVAALTQAFRARTQRIEFCALGSVKSNFGHLDAAAGVAGFIKTVLALEHKQIPPSLNFTEANPQLDLPNSPFFVNTVLREWEAAGHPRRAGVNSFGQGGTNAHAVLEEAPLVPAPENDIGRPTHLLTLSAKTEPALMELVRRYAAYLTRPPAAALPDICFTANTGRNHYEYRLAAVAGSIEQLQAQLAAFAAAESPAAVITGRAVDRQRPQVTLVLADLQAPLPAAWPQEIKELAASQPRFRQILDQGDALVASLLGCRCQEILFAPPDNAGTAGAARAVAHCLLAYALADLWRFWGVVPDAVAAQGYGEYVAAAIAGVLPLEEALRLAAAAARRKDRAEDQGEEVFTDLTLRPPRLPLISITAEVVVGPEVTEPEYWRRFDPQTRKEGGRAPAVTRDGNGLWLWIGPEAVAEPGATARALPAGGRQLPGWRRTETPWQYLLQRLAMLYAAGVTVDWTAFEAPYQRRRVVLPTYPMQRRRYWVEGASTVETGTERRPDRDAPPVATVGPAAPPKPASAATPDYRRIMELQVQTATEAVSQVITRQLHFLRDVWGGIGPERSGQALTAGPRSERIGQAAGSAPAMVSTGQVEALLPAAGPANMPATTAAWPQQAEAGQLLPETSALCRHDWQLWAISSTSEEGLDEESRKLIRELQADARPAPAGVFIRRPTTGAEGNWRRTVVGQGSDSVAELLASREPNRVLSHWLQSPGRPVAFMLPGIGEQYPNMARDLYESEAVFRRHVDHGCERLLACCGVDLLSTLYPPQQASVAGRLVFEGQGIDLKRLLRSEPSDEEGNRPPLDRTSLAHPGIFIIEYALAQLWLSWGISPQAMIGHSLGEYMAACLAGVMSFEEALRVVARRAAMIQELPPGLMLAVPLSEAAIQPLLGEDLFLAAVNAPSLSVISGTAAAAAELESVLREQGVLFRRLRATHPFHSPLMEPIAEELGALLKEIKLKPPRIPYLSNVTGRWIRPEEATDPGYWMRHTCQPVRFCEGIEALLGEAAYLLVEVGPGQALGSFVWQQSASASHPEMVVLPSLPSVYEQQTDQVVFLSSLARLWLQGKKVRGTQGTAVSHQPFAKIKSH
jgi:acyl transferase domain-containing protein